MSWPSSLRPPCSRSKGLIWGSGAPAQRAERRGRSGARRGASAPCDRRCRKVRPEGPIGWSRDGLPRAPVRLIVLALDSGSRPEAPRSAAEGSTMTSTESVETAATATRPPHGVSLREAFWVWLKVAALSFGGPAGQIAVMHRILVEEKRWISETRFLHALNYCMLLPGPEAQQLAVYVGWLMHRTLGGLMAGLLFILPGIIAIMALSYVYAAYGQVGIIAALFFGLKAAVLAIVVEAVVRVGKRALKNNVMLALAGAAF